MLARGPLPVERALEIGLQVVDTLGAAHARGVVHRDLKPGNISLTADGVAKVLDFGLAKGPSAAPRSRSGTVTPLTTITVPGQAMGTSGFLTGTARGRAADPRDDIYSFGIVLFELLTGRRPFEGTDALELAVATMTKTAVLAHQLNPAIPPEVSRIIARAIARDRDSRYQSADDLRAELRTVSRELTTRVTGPVSTGRLVVEPPRWRLAVPIVLLVVAGWAVAFGIWWNSTRVYQSDRTVPVIAILPFANNSAKPGDAPIAAAMRDVLIANLANLQGINVLSKSATGNAGAQPGDLKKLSRDLGITYLIDGSLQRSGDDLMVSVSLVRGESGLVVWSGSYSAPEKDIFALQGRIADGVSHAGPIGTSGAVQSSRFEAGNQRRGSAVPCGRQ